MMMKRRMLRVVTLALALMMLLTSTGLAETLKPGSSGNAVKRLQEAAGGNDGGRGTDDRHEEHQRPVQAGDKLIQRQHPVIRFRLAQGDAVEGGRDIQYRRERASARDSEEG